MLAEQEDRDAWEQGVTGTTGHACIPAWQQALCWTKGPARGGTEINPAVNFSMARRL